MLRLIDELCAAGAETITRPACPHCGRVVRLHRRLHGQWSCRNCVAKAGPPRWLFPGNDPTRPASHAHLRTGLSHHGITTHAARNTAAGALAAELAAPVLPGITGLNINTAARRTPSVGRDWTEYLATRTRHQDEMTGDERLLPYARHSS